VCNVVRSEFGGLSKSNQWGLGHEAAISISLNFLLITWPLHEKYTMHHLSFIARLRVAVKNFRTKLVSLYMSEHFMETYSLLMYTPRQNAAVLLKSTLTAP
jgi:hypothetical protein